MIAQQRRTTIRSMAVIWLSLATTWCSQMEVSNAFTTILHTTPRWQHATQLSYNRRSDDNNNNGMSFDTETLQRRIFELKIKILEEDILRPPNVKLTPTQFVEAVVDALLHNEEPVPDAGFKLLLRCSTEQWASKIYESIGAPREADVNVVASALGTAIARPNNQFAILAGDEDNGHEFKVLFPNEPNDFYDGTCWVSCELRDKKDNKLLVMMGWELEQREDGAWLVDKIDWQDFRDGYRPGIGREEWMRFCG